MKFAQPTDPAMSGSAGTAGQSGSSWRRDDLSGARLSDSGAPHPFSFPQGKAWPAGGKPALLDVSSQTGCLPVTSTAAAPDLTNPGPAAGFL